MVVTNTLDAIAGSIFIFFKVIGTTMPNSPATIIVRTIDIDIINESKESWNQRCTTKALIIAKIIPFKIPILNSFKMFCEILFLVKVELIRNEYDLSFVAIPISFLESKELFKIKKEFSSAFILQP